MSSFFVNRTNKSTTWRIVETYYENGKRKHRQVLKEAYQALGVNPEWTIEEARRRVRELNQSNFIKKKEIAAAARRVKENKIVESAYIPKEYAEEFVEELKLEASNGNEQKLIYQWNFVQTMIAHLKIEPKDYALEARRFYKYFQKTKDGNSISPSYSQKVLRILNLWGKFVSRKQRTYYEYIPNPKGVEAQRIKQAYVNGSNYQGPSDALTPEKLNEIRSKLPNEKQGNWCHVTVWLGTRPEETDGFIDKPESFRIEYDKQLKVNVLWVYQSKLVAIEEEKRWKPIPIIYKEQKLALEYIRTGALESPLNKTIRNLTKDQVTRYGGRKGFTDLMLGLGEDLDNISIWLGHQNINRTWKDYKDKQKVKFNGPKREAS